jgi:hypothetical protein
MAAAVLRNYLRLAHPYFLRARAFATQIKAKKYGLEESNEWKATVSMANCQAVYRSGMPCASPCAALPNPPQNPVDVFLSGPSRGSLHLLPFGGSALAIALRDYSAMNAVFLRQTHVHREFLKHGRHQGFANPGRICEKRELLVLLVHLIVTLARLTKPCGLRGVVAESV